MQVQRPSDEQRMVVESFRTFLASEVVPVVREFRDRHIPKGRMRELTQGLAEFGLPGASIAYEHGGLGLTLVTEAMLFEELCTVSMDVALCVLINKGVAMLLADLPATQAHLRERYLPDILAGRTFGSFCVSEPGTGSDLGDIRLSARREDDAWVVDGAKTWVSNGYYSDFVIAAANMGEGELAYLLVDRRTHGYVSRNIDKVALSMQSPAQILFSQTRVPADHLLWEESSGLKPALKLLARTRASVGMLSVGLMRAALEASVDYARQRTQFGKAIAAHQLVAAKLAEMATLVDAARLLCFRAFSLIEAGEECDVQASMAKWFATEMAVKVCRDAVQMHGSNGLTREFDVERLAREAMMLPIAGGTTEIQKLLIARALTDVSAFT